VLGWGFLVVLETAGLKMGNADAGIGRQIRASTLSGECRWVREFFANHQFKFTQQFQECVRRRAVTSVKMSEECKDDSQAVNVVNEVWDSCFTDTRPFDEIYR